MKDDEPEDRLLALLNLAFLALLFGLTVWYQTGRERVRGGVTHSIGSCDVDWYCKRSALVVACPGQDLIRVWPLPMEQPWWEDPVHGIPIVPTQMDVLGVGFSVRDKAGI